MSITQLPTPPLSTSPTTFNARADAFLAALPVFVDEANATAAAMTLNATIGTSATSNTIGTGSKTFTANTGKSWQLGMTLKVASTSSPTNYMLGEVTAYNSGTGSLTINMVATQGTGTFTAWTISQSVSLPTAKIDLTGYSGADVSLSIGQQAFYNVTAASTLALRIATLDQEVYEIEGIADRYTTSEAIDRKVRLRFNNTDQTGQVINQIYDLPGVTIDNAIVAAGGSPHRFVAKVSTSTKNKSVLSHFISPGSTVKQGIAMAQWTDSTTPYTSLGTLFFDFTNTPTTFTGQIIVRRIS